MAARIKGCICLDIDGTLTADPYKVPQEVVEFLHALYDKGWVFLFITGRIYSFASLALKDIRFPYFFSVQNGADLLLMPEQKILSQEYLLADIVPKMDEICQFAQEDFVIYSGWQKGDFCYYRPRKFSSFLLEHLDSVKAVSPRPWIVLDTFSFSKEDKFPLIKLFGTKEEMFQMRADSDLQSLGDVSCIRDPLASDENVYVTLLTAKGVSKGKIVQKMRSYFPKETLFIAAGDDYNDLSMLEEADISIAMKTGPIDLLTKADILADSAEHLGIIQALLEATEEKI